jgi:hypothetical protein
MITLTLATLTFGLPGAAQATPVTRFDALTKSESGLSVRYTLNDTRFGDLKGKFRMTFRKGFQVRIEAAGTDYEFVTTPTDSIEMEHVSQTFFTWRTSGQMGAPPGFVSEIPKVGLPIIFLESSLARYAGGNLTAGEQSTVEGQSVQKFSATSEVGTADIFLKDDGTPVRATLNIKTQQGEYRQTWTFSDLVRSNPESFSPDPRLGYTQIAMSREGFPVTGGSKFPSVTWPGGVRMNFSRPTLVVAVNSTCPNSKAMLESLKEFNGKTPIYVISDAMVRGLSGPSTRVIKAPLALQEQVLNIPGYPFTFLVGGDGVVQWTNFGFDRETPKKWAQEVRAALSAPR